MEFDERCMNFVVLTRRKTSVIRFIQYLHCAFSQVTPCYSSYMHIVSSVIQLSYKNKFVFKFAVQREEKYKKNEKRMIKSQIAKYMIEKKKNIED